MADLVTMVVPTLGNRIDWFELTLRSIRNQDIPCELIVVGPKDATQAQSVATAHGAKWLVEEGASIGAALNQGFRDATTPYLAWLGDDDLLTNGSLARTVERLEKKPNAVMAYGRILCIDEIGRTMFMIAPGLLASKFMTVGHDFVPQPGCLFRSSTFQEVGGVDESLRYAMDLDLFLRMRTRGSLTYVPEVLAKFRRHEGSLTVSNPDPGVEAGAVRLRYLSKRFARLDSSFRPFIEMFGKVWARGFFHDPRWRWEGHADEER